MRVLLALLVLGLVSAACVERRLTIRSEPSGALVVLDGEPLPAPTPITVALAHHGTHRVELEMPERAETTQEYPRTVVAVATRAPWYDHFPIDLFAEILWPGRLVQVDEVDVRLEGRPEEGPPDEALDDLLREAIALRREVESTDE